jgi:hypothetical protein
VTVEPGVFTADPIVRGGDYSILLTYYNTISAPPGLTTPQIEVRVDPEAPDPALWTGTSGAGITVSNGADYADLRVIIPKTATATFPVGRVWFDVSFDAYDVTAGASVHLAGQFRTQVSVVEAVSR